jgi:hypothetical protein
LHLSHLKGMKKKKTEKKKKKRILKTTISKVKIQKSKGVLK